MLNSPLSRSNQSSPRWHYAEPSPRISQLSRRPSKSIPQSPRPRLTSYVDAATQWSPRADDNPATTIPQEKEGNETEVHPLEPLSIPMEDVATAGQESPSEPVLKPETPSMKRRQSRATTEEGASGSGVCPTTPPKRARSDSMPTKILPLRYELCEVEDMVILIADMISELIQTNDALPLRTGVLTRFHSRTPPGISVLDYLQRLAKHATLTPPLLLSMVYYIDRLCALYPAFTVTTLTVHRFLITAATVAAKGLSDSFWNNTTYARVGGLKVAELGLLELDFLYRVDWKIVPNPEVLVDYYRGLVDRSDDYELEDDGASGEEEDGENPGSSTSGLEDRAGAGERTDTQWKAWMDDVSTKRADTEHDTSRAIPSAKPEEIHDEQPHKN
ncbi:nuc-1 negative regulatory protein preg [Phlyctema vagabunda]|uniref:Nuc-1 negative regulatory protein preg n=1 Tax=Phlyctema vagabunda TaxID=108571 RepID=A0ABR4P3J7_9HELO